MAKLTVTILLLSLVTFVASSKSGNGVSADHLPTLATEKDIIAAPDTTNPTLTGPELASPDEVMVPINFMHFHPINRHFPRRPLMTVPINHRPCHHHQRGFQVPFGNDMIISGEEKTTDSLSGDVVVTNINMVVGPFALEETKEHLSREAANTGKVEAEEEGSMKITLTRVRLIKRKEEGEGEGEREKNTLGRKIRKFLNHLV